MANLKDVNLQVPQVHSKRTRWGTLERNRVWNISVSHFDQLTVPKVIKLQPQVHKTKPVSYLIFSSKCNVEVRGRSWKINSSHMFLLRPFIAPEVGQEIRRINKFRSKHPGRKRKHLFRDVCRCVNWMMSSQQPEQEETGNRREEEDEPRRCLSAAFHPSLSPFVNPKCLFFYNQIQSNACLSAGQ